MLLLSEGCYGDTPLATDKLHCDWGTHAAGGDAYKLQHSTAACTRVQGVFVSM
jgi:hypothetical protein